ncbi:MAG: glycosyltransferase family 39 protein [Endomicrobium sp.]|jgi:hypothetical protein|uniref:hypothetical protein n=1 Tax=Candidatus Endomicrobiellum cubanum TaxID=3242325 RepID=UPI002829DF45|nr:glycosyltransferase family 39 protein [Endomicrobium sp.]
MKKSFFGNISFFYQKPLYILAVIIFIQILSIFYYSTKKKDLCGDEFVSLRIHIGFKVRDVFRCYEPITSYEFEKSLKVSKDGRFNYSRVYRNSKLDTGVPPLYYLVLYTAQSIYSLFSTSFSMYPGFILNTLFFVLASYILYFLSCFILEPDLALLPNLLWGFSAGAINSVLCLRMYILATAFYLLLLYCIFTIVRNKNAVLKDYLFLSLTIYFGVLTHYHFVVWASLVLIFFLQVYLSYQFKWLSSSRLSQF